MITNRSTHLSNVLVALDNSLAAASALPLARLVASQLDTGVEVLHVIAPQTDAATQHMGAPDIPARQIVGDSATEILRAANDPAAALLVLTTHGDEVPSGERLGHIAETVIANSVAPILLVRPEAAGAPRHGTRPLRRLLLPLDGTPTTARALQPIAALIHRLQAAVDVLIVAAPGKQTSEHGDIRAPRYVDQPHHEWIQWRSEVYERLCLHCAGLGVDTPARVFLTHGEIGAEIVRFAAEHHHDAIILVRRSKLEPGRADVLRSVLFNTPCPILLVGAPSD